MNTQIKANLIEIEGMTTPQPAKVDWVEHDGVKLRYARWHPKTQSKLDLKLGTILICTGRNEFIEKYYETINDLLELGHSVVVFDWRGQGQSTRVLKKSNLGHIRNYKDYILDFHAMFDHVLLPDCPAPFYVLGHSMGGLISTMAAAEVPQRVERMVLSAPLLKIKNIPLNHDTMRHITGAIKMLGLGWLPTYRQKDWKEITPFEDNVLTACEARYERNNDYLRKHPTLGVGCPSVGWLNATLKAMQQIHSIQFMDNYAVPTLMVSASKDRVVSSDAIDIYCSEMPYCQHLSLRSSEHEIMQESDFLRDQFLAAFKTFIPGSAV